MARSKKSLKKIQNLIFLMLITIVFGITATYAWFSTQRDVEIAGMRLNVEVAESLQISLDGELWSQSINIADMRQFYGTYQTTGSEGFAVYQAKKVADGGNQNYVPTELLPVSTAGEVANGKLKFVQGTVGTNVDGTQSLTAITACTETDITTSADVDDKEDNNADHPYFVFDMYLRNVSAKTEGIDELLLNAGSKVYVNTATTDDLEQEGKGKEATGLEYSARVGFIIYGNTVSVTAQDDATLGTVGEQVRGITANNSEVATIWEPNYKEHTQYVVNNNGRGITSLSQVVATYGIKSAVATLTEPNNNVIDINADTDANSDGIEDTNVNLVAVKTFKPTYNTPEVGTAVKTVMQDTQGNNIGLAPNQISKVRVYIWLEGQDPDCIDMASTGDKLSLDLKLTKEANVVEENTYTAKHTPYFGQVYKASLGSDEMTAIFYEDGSMVSYINANVYASIGAGDITYGEETFYILEGHEELETACELSEDRTQISLELESVPVTLTLQQDTGVKTASTLDKYDYGGYVTNYVASSGANLKWRIFHADGSNIYLIADRAIKNQYKPAGKNGTTFSQTPDYDEYNYEYASNLNALNDYTGTADIDSNLANKWLSKYTSAGYTATNTNANAKATAYLMDTNVWSGFKDSGGYAEYAIGCPTIELFAASYNVVSPNRTIETQVDENGYLIKMDEDSDFGHVIKNNDIAFEFGSLYGRTVLSDLINMCIASPSSSDGSGELTPLGIGNYIFNLSWSGESIRYYGVLNDYAGMRPVVCLKSNLKLDKQANGSYLIVE